MMIPEMDIFGADWDDVADDQCISEERCYELFEEDVQVCDWRVREEKIYDNWEKDLPQERQAHFSEHVLSAWAVVRFPRT